MAALDEWHKVKDSVSAKQPMNAQPLEAIKRLSRALEQAKAELYARPVPAEDGIVTVTTTEEGRCVMVSRQDEDHRILKVLWEAKDKPTEFVNARLLEASQAETTSFALRLKHRPKPSPKPRPSKNASCRTCTTPAGRLIG